MGKKRGEECRQEDGEYSERARILLLRHTRLFDTFRGSTDPILHSHSLFSISFSCSALLYTHAHTHTHTHKHSQRYPPTAIHTLLLHQKSNQSRILVFLFLSLGKLQ